MFVVSLRDFYEENLKRMWIELDENAFGREEVEATDENRKESGLGKTHLALEVIAAC